MFELHVFQIRILSAVDINNMYAEDTKKRTDWFGFILQLALAANRTCIQSSTESIIGNYNKTKAICVASVRARKESHVANCVSYTLTLHTQIRCDFEVDRRLSHSAQSREFLRSLFFRIQIARYLGKEWWVSCGRSHICLFLHFIWNITTIKRQRAKQTTKKTNE